MAIKSWLTQQIQGGKGAGVTVSNCLASPEPRTCMIGMNCPLGPGFLSSVSAGGWMEITQLIISEYKEVPLALTPMGRVSASIIDNLGGCLKFKPVNKVFLSSSLWGSNTMHNRQRGLVWLFFSGFNQDTWYWAHCCLGMNQNFYLDPALVFIL